jgi:GrpB-like predicted nucleotidyltransferase (UPF0157 family)
VTRFPVDQWAFLQAGRLQGRFRKESASDCLRRLLASLMVSRPRQILAQERAVHASQEASSLARIHELEQHLAREHRRADALQRQLDALAGMRAGGKSSKEILRLARALRAQPHLQQRLQDLVAREQAGELVREDLPFFREMLGSFPNFTHAQTALNAIDVTA